MGDVLTHAQITAHVVEQLKGVLGPQAIPEEDYTYIELGNFLTDVKQFRDPVAFHKGRDQARAAAAAQAGGLAGAAGVDEWATTMFGQKEPGPRHGAVPEFLRLLGYAFTHEVFDPDGLTRTAQSNLPGANPALVPAHAIDPAEVDRVLEERFDQYWPHDHMDFPPVADLARHRELPLFRPMSNGMIGFLWRYVNYLAEELSKLEFDWASADAAQLTTQAQRDFLVRIGTLLHAVEDYFFHSNFTELRQWQVVRRHFRGMFDPGTQSGREELFRRSLWGSRHAAAQPDEEAIHLRRHLFRRLRYPVFESDGRLSSWESEDATEILYTGGFYTTDVYHTLGGALEAVERFAPLIDPAGHATNSQLVLVRLAFSEDARRELVRGGADAAKALRDEHARQLENGAYTDAIARRRAGKNISAQAANRLDEAIALDKQQEAAYKFLPGPGAILVTLLADLQRERDESARSAKSFDRTVQSITIERSSNDASAENIGTHSLLSKDSDDKEPFREEALVLAKHASAGVATVLARRLKGRVPIESGIDWREVLLFFLRDPEHPSRHWEEELLIRMSRQGNTFRQPDVDQVRDKPRFALLGPRKGADSLARLRAGKVGDELKQYYQSFESNPKP